MSKCLHAFTALTPSYPPYINVTKNDDETYTVIVRSEPTTHEGVYICGYSGDKGQFGRCTPGDERCNNYCNMAPEKGPMQKSALPCTHIKCGDCAQIKLDGAQIRELYMALHKELVG